jgi:hypothetical protein
LDLLAADQDAIAILDANGQYRYQLRGFLSVILNKPDPPAKWGLSDLFPCAARFSGIGQERHGVRSLQKL